MKYCHFHGDVMPLTVKYKYFRHTRRVQYLSQ